MVRLWACSFMGVKLARRSKKSHKINVGVTKDKCEKAITGVHDGWHSDAVSEAWRVGPRAHRGAVGGNPCGRLTTKLSRDGLGWGGAYSLIFQFPEASRV